MTDNRGSEDTVSAIAGEVRTRREAVRSSMIALEQAIAAPQTDDATSWIKRVHAELDTFRGVWAHHVEATERPDGLLDRVRHEVPRLSHEHDLLHREHGDIAAAIEETAATHDVDAVREAVIALLGKIVRHRSRGANFVYEAYSLDVGSSE
ncbi:MAG TPA: hypothetical protein VHN98_01575 [Acidimicrobiales bacterium]|nr:hypothetical protein [Acidimicrobiales bacterium]